MKLTQEEMAETLAVEFTQEEIAEIIALIDFGRSVDSAIQTVIVKKNG